MGDNLLPSGPDATRIRDSILLTPARSGRVTNSAVRIGGNCAPKHTKGSTMEEREKFWDDFINEFDNIELHDGNGSTCSPNTNLKGSKDPVWLHPKSKNKGATLKRTSSKVRGRNRMLFHDEDKKQERFWTQLFRHTDSEKHGSRVNATPPLAALVSIYAVNVQFVHSVLIWKIFEYSIGLLVID